MPLGIFFNRSPQQKQERYQRDVRQAASEGHPTFVQQLTGAGKYMQGLRNQRKQTFVEYKQRERQEEKRLKLEKKEMHRDLGKIEERLRIKHGLHYFAQEVERRQAKGDTKGLQFAQERLEKAQAQFAKEWGRHRETTLYDFEKAEKQKRRGSELQHRQNLRAASEQFRADVTRQSITAAQDSQDPLFPSAL